MMLMYVSLKCQIKVEHRETFALQQMNLKT